MVAREKRAFTSSREGALLIDQLIEALDAQMEADPARASCVAHPRPDARRPRSRSASS